MPRIQLGQLEVCGMSFPIAHHHHWYLIFAGTPGGADATTLAGGARQLALSLEGLQKEGLVDLHHATFVCRLMLSHLAQEAMTPQKGGVLTDPALLGSIANGTPLNQRCAVIEPVLGFAQTGQRCVGQGIAGAQTGFATIAPQAALPTPANQLLCRRGAVRTSKQVGEGFGQHVMAW